MSTDVMLMITLETTGVGKKTAWFPAFCRQDNGGDEELTI
jgi:hypothetical protein